MRFLRHIAAHTLRWFLIVSLCTVVPILVLWSLTRMIEGTFLLEDFAAKILELRRVVGLLALFAVAAGVYFGVIAAWAERR